MIRAIFWDNDGVLVNTEGIFFKANQEILAGLGISLGIEQFEEISLLRGQSVMSLAAPPGTEEYEKLRRDRNALYADLLTREPLVIDGVREVLQALQGKYVMGIVTSSGHEHFEIIHRSTGLLTYFQFIITLKDCSQTKPHPEPYLKAITLSGFTPRECLVIEDSPRGLAAALSAGIPCVIIPNKLTGRHDFAGAFRVLNSIRDLPETLKEFQESHHRTSPPFCRTP